MPSTYPSALDTDQSLYIAVNDFATTLSSNINSGQGTIPVASISTLPAFGLVAIDGEIIQYTALQVSPPALLGCVRGFDGTAGAAHSALARVEMRWVADHHNMVSSATAAIERELGLLPKGSHASVADRLDKTAPAVVEFSPAAADWSFTHDRGRLVHVQLYRKTGPNSYELFEANIEQVIDVTSEVNIVLTSAEEGYAIYV